MLPIRETTYKGQEENMADEKVLTNEPVLCAKDLEIQFSLRGRMLKAIRSCSIDVYEGETLAIVGESGSGKSVLTKSFIGMLDANGSVSGGSIVYRGEDISKYKTEEDWLRIRGKKIAMVMQDPMTSLNPLKTVGAQIRESIELHQGLSGNDARDKTIETLVKVGITDPQRRYRQYPHEFSGGMRQRVVIATAIACRPEILICDEPTTALDVTIQAQILDLIRNLQSELHMTIIYITHDLGVVANVAERVAVMYAGQIVEYGLVNEIYYNAWHPYTWALLSSLPQLGVKGEDLSSIEGTPPNLFNVIQGDAFAPRNKMALAIDFVKEPPLFTISQTHKAKTWYLDPRAPKIEQPEVIRRMREKLRTEG
jgi:oligopeptide transport system ATP-binding protein